VVLAPGPLMTVQDLGRRGWAHVGLGRSGAADETAHRLANRLVGNVQDAATLEITMGGAELRFDAAHLVALTGAACGVGVDGGPPLAHQQPTAVPAGCVVRLAVPDRGLRTYLAIRGGIDVAPVLGSRSTDLLSGTGPAPLAA